MRNGGEPEEAVHRGSGDEATEPPMLLVRAGGPSHEARPHDFMAVVVDCWTYLDPAAVRLDCRVAEGATVVAPPGPLEVLVDTLLRNAVEHRSTSHRRRSDEPGARGASSRQASPDSAAEPAFDRGTVAVGWLEAGDGFFVEGPGAGADGPDRTDDASPRAWPGPHGRSALAALGRAHGWDVTVGGSAPGVPRFEVTGVERGERD